MNKRCDLPYVPLTAGPKHHFFGYYGICPWDSAGRRALCTETEFSDRPPGPADKLTLGFIDTDYNNQFTKIAETRAWNFQQGCFLRWNPAQPHEVIYNDRADDKFISVLLNIFNGQKKVLPMPIYDISSDGKVGLSLSFARLNDTRPGYGYCGVDDIYKDAPYPAEDGIYRFDIETGKFELIISYAKIAEEFLKEQALGRKLWFNHIMFNKSATRFVFLARYQAPLQPSGATWLTSMFTANSDGSEIYCLSKNKDISHFDWYDDTRLAVWTERPKYGRRYYMLTDKTQYFELIGKDILTEDGHCSFSPDGKWMVTDTYPDADNLRTLLLFNMKKERKIVIGQFEDDKKVWGENWELRCDLHPRWDRKGSKICFDSVMDNSRQMYSMDVSDLTT